MDISSEMVHSLLPVYLVAVLAASPVALGAIEGTAEAVAALFRVPSGVLSDRLARRRAFVLAGYGLSALVKPLFPLAASVGWVFAARALDRVGKGIRTAPRDALIGELAPPEIRGACFGLRQSLDNVGAVTGPLLAIALMAATGGDFRAVFWAAIGPAWAAVLVLALTVREPARPAEVAAAAPRLAEVGRLGPTFWWATLAGVLMTIGRGNRAFQVLRADQVGLGPALVPVAIVIMNAVYAVTSYPAGRLADRVGWRAPMVAGVALLVAADLLQGLGTTVPVVLAGVACYGVHMGITQGLLAMLVSLSVAPDRRGTAFGVFSLVNSVVLLANGVAFGWLWERIGPGGAFLAIGLGAVAALPAVAVLGRRLPVAAGR
jgi:MFS family permease